jgi:hypothetical protein
LAIYNKMKDKQKDCLLWGDEVIFWMVASDGRRWQVLTVLILCTRSNILLSHTMMSTKMPKFPCVYLKCSPYCKWTNKNGSRIPRISKLASICLYARRWHHGPMTKWRHYSPAPATSWRPEYGRFMLEGTPGSPYGSTLKDLLLVEPNMKLRRKLAQQTMKSNEIPLTIVSYPRLGCQGEFLDPHYEPLGDSCRSLFVPDEIINPHARFP